MQIPESYTISKFNTYAGDVRETSYYMNGGCPICHEGNNWGKKRRLYYMKNDDYIYCHNCNKGWSPYFWIKEVTGMSFKDIKEELQDYSFDGKYELITTTDERVFDLPALPGECVNLLDPTQLKYYDNIPIVHIALQYIRNRNIINAINRPTTFYVCIKDRFHENRLVIPYYNEYGQIKSYITRTLLDSDKKAKYLIKFGSDKPIFNIEKIDSEYPYIFIFEGQIDSMFMKNGIAVSGTSLTKSQEEELDNKYPFHNKIWVLDNFNMEEQEVKDKIIEKCKKGETIFLFENEFSKFKDFGDYCKEKKLDQVDPALVLKYSYTGMKALCRL